MAITITSKLFSSFVCNVCFHSARLLKYRRCSKINGIKMLITVGLEYTAHYSSHSNETVVCRPIFFNRKERNTALVFFSSRLYNGSLLDESVYECSVSLIQPNVCDGRCPLNNPKAIQTVMHFTILHFYYLYLK